MFSVAAFMVQTKDYIIATRNHNELQFESGRKFGNSDTAGLQHKGMAIVNSHPKFVKLDELNPTVQGDWENKFDYQYSSVSEAIVTCLIRNMDTDTQFKSVEYDFELFDMGNKKVSGTISDNYLSKNESEWILSSGHTTVTHTTVDLDTYVSKVIDVKSDSKLPNLIDMMVNQNVNPETAKHFLIQQIGFDILTGNRDRLNNPSNFVFAHNVEKEESYPVNMDYGRCLQLPIWSKTAEQNFELESEYYEEDIDDFAKDMISKNDSIYHSLNINESISKLNENGYQPFKINMANLTSDLDKLKDKINSLDVPFKKFATVKIEAFKQALQLPQIQKLWQNTEIQLDFSGLEERNDTHGTNI